MSDAVPARQSTLNPTGCCQSPSRIQPRGASWIPTWYNVTRFWPKSELGDVMPFALREGLVRGDELPEPPEN
jgi:hypothetical protein